MILVVGHTIVPAALAVEIDYAPPVWLAFLIWLPLTIISALALLQPAKGAIVALQWQLGMHGFGLSKLRRLAIAQSHVAASTVAGNANEYIRARLRQPIAACSVGPVGGRCVRLAKPNSSRPENLAVALLDLLSLRLGCYWIAFHQPDRGQRLASGPFLRERME